MSFSSSFYVKITYTDKANNLIFFDVSNKYLFSSELQSQGSLIRGKLCVFVNILLHYCYLLSDPSIEKYQKRLVAKKRWFLEFLKNPVEILTDTNKVTGIRFEQCRLEMVCESLIYCILEI